MIRLADRQGVLQGRSLSTVQQFANSVMLHLEDKAGFEGRIDSLKNVLLSASPDPISYAPALYPDLFPPEDLDSLDLEEVPEDNLPGRWKFLTQDVEDFLRAQGIPVPDRHS